MPTRKKTNVRLRARPVLFAFVDECKNTKVNPPLLSCTALTVDAREYDDLRLGIYKVLEQEIRPEPNHYHRVPELKFSNFLPSGTEERKVAVLTALSDLAVSSGCKLARVGYFMTPGLMKSLGDSFHEPDLYGLCFLGLRNWFGHLAKTSFVIPVIDLGLSESFQRQARAYSGSESMMHVLRAFTSSTNVAVPNPGGVADASYSDSKHSALIGLVDCLGGLRKITDILRVSPTSALSPYHSALLPIAKKLDAILDADDIVSLECDGVVEGPAEFAGAARRGASNAPIGKAVRLT